MGDQPPYGQPMQPQNAGAKWGPTSIGLEAHIAAGLSYFFSPILPLIFFFIEKNNRFVKFHALQSILLGVAGFIWYFIIIIASAIVSGASSVATNGASSGLGLSCIIGCLGWIGGLGLLGLFIWGLIAGFTGKWTKLPVIGGLAEQWAGGPATPAM